VSIPWQEILGLLNEIIANQQRIELEQAIYNETITLKNQVLSVQQALGNPVSGLAAAHAERVNLNTLLDEHLDLIDINIAGVAAQCTTIIDDIAAIEIPTEQPEWYVPPPDMILPADIADAIWMYPSEFGWDGQYGPVELTMWDIMSDQFMQSRFAVASEGSPLAQNPYVRLVVPQANLATYIAYGWDDETRPDVPPVPDWSHVLETDTMLGFLQREQPTIGWGDTGPGNFGTTGNIWAPAPGPGGKIWFRWTLGDLDLLQIFRAYNPPEPPAITVPPAPPVWPGAANVTLGTPVALSTGLTVTEAMDGVLIHITAVDPKQMYFTYDDTKAYRHIGALAFVADNGKIEGWQGLGFPDAIYCPRHMEHAAAVKIMTPGGTEGTVTPWVVTPA
jgi:hypothetical protein